MKQEVLTPEVFQFSSTKQDVRSLLLNGEPWLVAKDVCDILGIVNHKDAIKALDDDEVGKTYLGVITGTKKDGTPAFQKVNVNIVNESGLYTLIMRSNKPEAKAFRKWVTGEVLPAIRKRGYYGVKPEQKEGFIDARDIPYNRKEFNGAQVRVVDVTGDIWLSINDLHTAIGSRTESTQVARKLNQKRILARKIWLFGNTHPSWFTNQLGCELILSGSRIVSARQQLKLNFSTSL